MTDKALSRQESLKSRIEAKQAEAAKLASDIESLQAELRKPAGLLPDGFTVRLNMVSPWVDNEPPPQELFDAWRAAIFTFVAIRKLPGCVPAQDGVSQWMIGFDNYGRYRETFGRMISRKYSHLSPCFATDADAHAAADAIGHEEWDQMCAAFNEGVRHE